MQAIAKTSKSPMNWRGLSFEKGQLNLVGIIASIGAVLSFFPAFSVSYEAPLAIPAKPLSALFLVRYESIVPVADVDVECSVSKLESQGVVYRDLTVEASQFHVDRLWQGDSLTVPCVALWPLGLLSPLLKGDITIIVSYRPLLIPKLLKRKPLEKHFRFITIRQSDGRLRWISEPDDYVASWAN